MIAQTAAELKIINCLVSCHDNRDVGVMPRTDCERCKPNHRIDVISVLNMQTYSSSCCWLVLQYDAAICESQSSVTLQAGSGGAAGGCQI